MTDWVLVLFSGALGAVLATALTTLLSWRATWVSYNEAATQRALDVDRLFLNYPHIRTYFYKAKPDQPQAEFPSAEAEPLVHAAMEFIADNLEGIWDFEDVYSDSDWDAWLKYIQDMLTQCPSLSDFIAKDEYKWYPSLEDLQGVDPSEPRPRVRRLRRLWNDALGKA